MTLSEYLQAQGHGAVTAFMRASGVMRWATIDKARKGLLRDVDVALTLSQATGGQVSAASMLGLPDGTTKPLRPRS
jgi:hypothetical protein